MTELNKVKQNTKIIDEAISFVTPTKRTVLLCANGFQTTDIHDATPMFDYFNQHFKKDYPLCEIVPVLLFEPSDTKTHHKKLYEKKLRAAIEKYIKEDCDIMLMGYSFSGSLVSKMAYVYKPYIKRVILVAPIYDTILNNMIPGYLKYAKKFSDLNKKYGDRVSKAMGRQTVKGLFPLLISIFLSILENRHYMKKITQDTLLIRGEADVMFTNHALKKVDRHIKGHHNVYLYPNISHTCLKTARFNGMIFEDILHFAFNTPFIISKNEKLIVNKVENKPKVQAVDSDGEKIPTFGEIFESLDPDCNNDKVGLEDEV